MDSLEHGFRPSQIQVHVQSVCFYYYCFLLLFQNALSFSRSAVADDNVLFHVCCCRLSCFVLYLLFQTHDNHFTGEKSVPTPLSCTSVLQTWTKDTGLCVYLRPSQTSYSLLNNSIRSSCI